MRRKLVALLLLALLIILPGCKSVSKEMAVKKVAKESPTKQAEQEIKKVIRKWCSAFKEGDYSIQWGLLSSNSPIRKRFMEMEAFGPFKGYEIYRIVVKQGKAKAYLILHWGGYRGMGEVFIRPMGKKLVLELVKEKDKWMVFDEKDGFEDLAVRARTGRIKELVFAKEGGIVEILPSQDRSAIFVRTATGKLGIFDVKKQKFIFLPLFLGKEANFLQAQWSPSGEVLGIHYDFPREPVGFLPTLSLYKKNGESILTEEVTGHFFFISDKSVVWISEKEGFMEIVEYNLAKNSRRTLWDYERSGMERVIPLLILAVSKDKIVIKGRPFEEGSEWEYSTDIVGVIDIKSNQFQKLTDKWFIFSEACALKGKQLAFFGGRAKIEADREVWEEISLVTIDLISRKEKVIKFLGDEPAENLETLDHFSWSPSHDEIAFTYGRKGLFLASLEKGEFQGIYPFNLDWQESSRTPVLSSPTEIWAVHWSPQGNKLIFVSSPGKVFVASRKQIWESVEVEELSQRIAGSQCYWLSEKEAMFVGWKKAGEKDKPRAYAEPEGIYALDVSLK